MGSFCQASQTKPSKSTGAGCVKRRKQTSKGWPTNTSAQIWMVGGSAFQSWGQSRLPKHWIQHGRFKICLAKDSLAARHTGRRVKKCIKTHPFNQQIEQSCAFEGSNIYYLQEAMESSAFPNKTIKMKLMKLKVDEYHLCLLKLRKNAASCTCETSG